MVVQNGFIKKLPHSGGGTRTLLVNVQKNDTFLWLSTRVPLCLVGVGLKSISWAVRYLDKPSWRAVVYVYDRVVKL